MKPRLKKKKDGYASIEEDRKQQSKPMRKSKRTPKRSGKNNAATQDDYKLRQAVEGGALIKWRVTIKCHARYRSFLNLVFNLPQRRRHPNNH